MGLLGNRGKHISQVIALQFEEVSLQLRRATGSRASAVVFVFSHVFTPCRTRKATSSCTDRYLPQATPPDASESDSPSTSPTRGFISARVDKGGGFADLSRFQQPREDSSLPFTYHQRPMKEKHSFFLSPSPLGRECVFARSTGTRLGAHQYTRELGSSLTRNVILPHGTPA